MLVRTHLYTALIAAFILSLLHSFRFLDTRGRGLTEIAAGADFERFRTVIDRFLQGIARPACERNRKNAKTIAI